MKIEIKQLRMITEDLFSHLEKMGYREVEISEDYYWSIDTKELYDPANNPKDLALGQLSFDWETLTGVLERKKDAIAWHLIPLSSILRNIGENIQR